MSKERRITWLVALLLLGAAVVIGVMTWGTQESRLDGSAGVAIGDARSFEIAGEVSQPMRPGVQVPIDLSVANPYDVAISISDVNVSVTAVRRSTSDASLPCSVEDFKVDQMSETVAVTVDGNSDVSLSTLIDARARPTVGLLDRAVNQDGCKNATVELAYTARARRAG